MACVVPQVVEAFTARMEAMLASSTVEIPPGDKLPGILLLLVHPHAVRRV
jgi:hypothetical protein